MGKKTKIEISERLKYTWEQYLNISKMLISLASGSLIFYVNVYLYSVDKKDSELELYNLFFKLAIISVFGALIFTIIWRMLSQIGMEKEILGNKLEVKKYFKQCGIINNYTSFYEKKSDSKWLRFFWLFSHYTSIILIMLSWSFFIVSVALMV